MSIVLDWVKRKRRQVRHNWRTGLILLLAVGIFVPPQRAFATGDTYVPPAPPLEEPPCDPAVECCDSPDGSTPPMRTSMPVYLRNGSVLESATDLRITGPAFDWALTRSYNSMGTGSSGHGNRWLSSAEDFRIAYTLSPPSLVLLNDASSGTPFSGSANPADPNSGNPDPTTWTLPPIFTAPDDTSYICEAVGTSPTNITRFIVTDRVSNEVFIFYGPQNGNSSLVGLLEERTTLQWRALSMTGYTFDYVGRRIQQITTPEGQEYAINFTNSGGRLTTVSVKRIITTPSYSEQILYHVAYRYFGGTDNAHVGNDGDLVQVLVSSRASTDPVSADPNDLSIKRYTHYRYHTSGNKQLKAVYEHDALVRATAHFGGTIEGLLTRSDTEMSAPHLQDFASRAFTFYPTGDASTTAAVTAFTAPGSENLQSKYGGANVVEANFVQTETIRGNCASCGSGGPAGATITRSYHYMDLAQGDPDQNEVVRLVVEDTKSSDGPAYRIIYGLNDSGRLLRKAFVHGPVNTDPVFWCESWKMAPVSGTMPASRVAEERFPSAHSVTKLNIAAFLDPYNSEAMSGGWTNDSDTLHDTAGLIHVFNYNEIGMKTALKAKQGESGAERWINVWVFGDETETASSTGSLLLQSIEFPTPADAADYTSVSDRIVTDYEYDFYHGDYREIAMRRVKSAAVPTTQNGPGTMSTDRAISEEYYDTFGRLRWTKDAEGFITYYAYNPVTGGLAYQIVDANPASMDSEFTDGTAGWCGLSDGGANTNKPSRDVGLPSPLHLVTKTYFDLLRRVVRKVGPGADAHCYAYSNTQMIEFPYWDDATDKTLIPARVTTMADGVNVTETAAIRAGFSVTAGTDGNPTKFASTPGGSDYVELERRTYGALTGQLDTVDRYHNTSSLPGDLNTNYHRTVYRYDGLGRLQFLIQQVSGRPGASENGVEQVTEYAYDSRDRQTAVKRVVSLAGHSIGADYSSIPTATLTEETFYDGGGVGDGYVTKTRTHHNGAFGYAGKEYFYTFRGHLKGVRPFHGTGTSDTSISPFTVYDSDWRGNPIAESRYDSLPSFASLVDYATNAGGSGAPSATNRRSLKKSYYDRLGRRYRTELYKISASTGDGVHRLTDDTYYDRLNRGVARVKQGAAAVEKAYDGAGRLYQRRTVLSLSSTPFDSGKFQYREPLPKRDMTITDGNQGMLELVHSNFDNSGNVISRHKLEVNHDDAVGTGSARGISASGNDYIRQSEFFWYDLADRLRTSANYGSGDGTSSSDLWQKTSTPSPSSEPTSSSAMALVTKYGYHGESGMLDSATNPAGKKIKAFYDQLGRVTYLADNWDDFAPGSGSGDSTDKSKDQVVGFTYNGLDARVTLTALDVNADGNPADNQTTTYLYENSIGAERVTNEIYPDSSDTDSTGTDQVKLAYNTDGTLASRQDQRGTIMEMAYDERLQLKLSKVTTLGTAEGTVRSIGREYDSLGRIEYVTSYANSDGTGTVLNEIQYQYNDLDQVRKSYQSHQNDAIGSSPVVEYVYDETQTSNVLLAQHRLEKVKYPTTREVAYFYESGDHPNNRLSRVRSIHDSNVGSTRWLLYDYNGLDRLVSADFRQAGVRLDYNQSTAAAYPGYDRFGRVVDQYWYRWSVMPQQDIDRVKYGYDYAGNRLYNDSVLDSNTRDQAYAYDGLHRLKHSDEGNLVGTSISGPKTFEQDWTLDTLGNWSTFVDKAAGSATLNQQRKIADPMTPGRTANEIWDITENSGQPAWITPAYDAAGNMTTIPKPADLPNGYTATYDAWNRLVKISSGMTSVAEFEYDGLHRRIVNTCYTGGGSVDYRLHYYYNEDWQALEVRKESSGGTIAPYPLEQFIWHPYYVDALAVRFYDAATSNSQQVRNCVHDANYNVTAELYGGTVQERYRYSPYGQVRVLEANFTADSDNITDVGNRTLFAGRELDNTGLYYYRSRYFHSQCGSFITRDGIDSGDPNRYRYVENRPTVAVDPNGETIIIPLRPMPIVRPLPIPKTSNPMASPLPRSPLFGPHGPVTVPEKKPVGPDWKEIPPDVPRRTPWKCPEIDSDCGPGTLARLNGEVDKACNSGKNFNSPSYPAPSKLNKLESTAAGLEKLSEIYSTFWSCDGMRDLTEQWGRCCAARRNRENLCFRGGDRTHRYAIANCEFQVSFGYYLLRYWDCDKAPGFPQGFTWPEIASR